MSTKRVVVAGSRSELAELVADKFLVRVRKCVKRHGVAHIVLTGGSVAGDIHRAIAAHEGASSVDWSGVHFWWGDERYVADGHPDRNDHQARADMLRPLGVPESNIHPMPAQQPGLTPAQAASDYLEQLRHYGTPEDPFPVSDIAFAGVGPDGHVLSVFPGSTEAGAESETVLGVNNSPIAPTERITMTIGLLNRSTRVWVVASGAKKASAIGLALAGAHVSEVPASGLSGRHSTKIFIDAELAEGVPDELVERQRFWSADDERADYVPNALR